LRGVTKHKPQTPLLIGPTYLCTSNPKESLNYKYGNPRQARAIALVPGSWPPHITCTDAVQNLGRDCAPESRFCSSLLGRAGLTSLNPQRKWSPGHNFRFSSTLKIARLASARRLGAKDQATVRPRAVTCKCLSVHMNIYQQGRGIARRRARQNLERF